MISGALQQDLNHLQDQGLLRLLKSRTQKMGRLISIDKKEYLNFCSNDYLGLASDPRLVKAANAAMDTEGFGSGASRLVVGNMNMAERLEEEIAQLKGAEECLVFNSGYACNTGIIQALMGREDIIFSDRLNHASIIDGCILSRAEVKRYAHVDMDRLEAMLKQGGKYRRRLIVTDSVFSMDGDVAPLRAIIALAKQYDAWVMVDEAHGFGVLGQCGAGLAEQLGLTGDIDIHMGTLSKAAGTFGAYVCGRKPLRSYLINHARSLIYSTALPAVVIGAARAAVAIIRSNEGSQLRQNLMQSGNFVRTRLQGLGFDTLNSVTPIIPVILKDATKAVAVSKHLQEQGIYVSAIRPPTVPVNAARLRITVTASHTQEDLEALIGVMRKI